MSEVAVYSRVLDQVVQALAEGRQRTAKAANLELLLTYHRVGSAILTAQREQGWGAKTIDRLSADLRTRFPDHGGLGPRNLRSMRDLAAAWTEDDLATTVAELPWGHVTVLLSRLPDRQVRDWYAHQAAANRWSRRFLEDRIKAELHLRAGSAPSNFPTTLEPADAEQAQQLTRDPVLLDFLGLADGVHERDVERAMVSQITRVMLELGDGLAFVGQQVPVDVDGREYLIDLLFFSIPQSRYVVVELKTGDFDPRDAGQLNFYVNVLDAQRRDPRRHSPTIGLLLCGSKSAPTVRYALAGLNTPMAVASYSYDTLPADAQAAVPSEQDLARTVPASPRSQIGD